MENKQKNQTQVYHQESYFPQHKIVVYREIKRGFEGKTVCNKNWAGLKEAIFNWPQYMKAAIKTNLKSIEVTGINVIKQVELFSKYYPIIHYSW